MPPAARKAAAAKATSKTTTPAPTGAGPDPEGHGTADSLGNADLSLAATLSTGTGVTIDKDGVHGFPEGQALDPVRVGLRKLREPFPPEAVGKLPRSTCRNCSPRQTCDRHTMVWKCEECGGNHSSATIHLDYVGHADLTARLLEVDPFWTWEPFSQEQILALPPAMRDAGLWINLTVLGVTRPGFGDADGKSGGNAVKEAIGDALRNAGMRFGAALDLWAKGDRARFHAPDETPEPALPPAEQPPAEQPATGGRGDGTSGSVHHARVEQLDDMTRAELAAVGDVEVRRWDTHMGAFWDTYAGLSPAQQQAAQQGWPQDVPTPDSGHMTIRQIGAARERMKALAQDPR